MMNMLSCFILGDSIAYGTGQFFPECKTSAKIGISPLNYEKTFLEKDLHAENFIVSLGSNNPGEHLKKDLTRISKKLHGNIIWILPNDKVLKEKVKSVAISLGHKYVEFEVSKDNIHPKSYKSLSIELKKF
jgi:translation initiation factor IF-1